MSSGPPHRAYTRTDLFLVRIWIKDAGTGISDEAGSDAEVRGDSIGMLEWRGTVQRAVDGEAHQFSSWQGLLDVLLAMLSNNIGRQKR